LLFLFFIDLSSFSIHSFSVGNNIVSSDAVIIVLAVEYISQMYRLLFIQSKNSGAILSIISVSTQRDMA
jgi:hypothetical protein